jgi:hypothetical protein
MEMRTFAFSAGLLSIVIPLGASAARFPNAVEKQIVVSGDAATTVADLLGLTSPSGASASLKLDRHDAWMVYLLKHPTDQELTNGDGPDRYNVVKFTASPRASLSIGPFWLDLGTGAPNSQPGYYLFGSPFLPETLRSGDPWTRLVRRLRSEPGWNNSKVPQFQRCVTSPERTEICIRVYGTTDYTNNVERNGYSATITAHPSY